MDPDQTWEQSNMCPYCLQYWLHKNIIGRQECVDKSCYWWAKGKTCIHSCLEELEI